MSKEFNWTDELVSKSVKYWINEASNLGFEKALEKFKAEHSQPKISDADVTPPVILTTEDGVEVRDGNQYVWGTTVITDSDSMVGRYKARDAKDWHGDGRNIAFSTEEKALEYIRLNKVRHSDKDVMQLVEKAMLNTITHADTFTSNRKIITDAFLSALEAELNNKQ